MSTVRVRLDLSYRGTDFAGWAIQPGLRTVQGVLESGINQVLRTTDARLTVAGRTDAGVHARRQVAHLDLGKDVWDAIPGRSTRTPGESLVIRLTGVLPRDVVVRGASEAPEGFHARFSALRRRYAYRIADTTSLRDPLTRESVLWNRAPLDVDAMARACAPLIGLHDFAAYCRPRPGATTIRELLRLSWTRPSDGADAGLAVARVEADAFCHNMVRSLVSASIAVGEGRRDDEWPARLLVSRQRDAAAGVIAPHGLVLEEVVYPPDADLAARARDVRARRMDEEVWGD